MNANAEIKQQAIETRFFAEQQTRLHQYYEVLEQLVMLCRNDPNSHNWVTINWNCQLDSATIELEIQPLVHRLQQLIEEPLQDAPWVNQADANPT